MKNPAIQRITMDLNIETGEITLASPAGNVALEKVLQFIFHGAIRKAFKKKVG